MKNFSYSGQSITFTASEELESGQPYLLKSAFGVVSNKLLVGQSGELFVTGVWHFKKQKQEFKNGQPIYWDTLTKTFTDWVPLPAEEKGKRPFHYKLVGMVAEDAGVDQNDFLCRLNGITV